MNTFNFQTLKNEKPHVLSLDLDAIMDILSNGPDHMSDLEIAKYIEDTHKLPLDIATHLAKSYLRKFRLIPIVSEDTALSFIKEILITANQSQEILCPNCGTHNLSLNIDAVGIFKLVKTDNNTLTATLSDINYLDSDRFITCPNCQVDQSKNYQSLNIKLIT